MRNESRLAIPASACLAVALLGLLPGRVAHFQSPEDVWLEAPFTGTVTITRRMAGSKRLDGGGSVSRGEQGTVRAQVHGCKPEKDDEGAIIGCRPFGTVNTTAEGEYTIAAKNTTVSIVASGSGTDHFAGAPDDGSGMPRLSINPGRGLYRLSLPAGHAKGSKQQTVSIADPPYQEKESSTWRVSMNLDVDEEVEKKIRDRSYSPKTGMISGSFTVVRVAAGTGELPSAGDADGRPIPGLTDLDIPGAFDATYTVTWSLSLNAGPKVKAVIEPASDYEQWIPVGDEDKNQLTVKLKLTEPPGAKGYWTVKLDPSREPGECLNYPPPDQRDDKPDLVFASEQPADLDITEDRLTATTQDKEAELVVGVASKDWGAHGALTAKVVVVTESGLEEVEATYEATGEPRLVLPKDDDDNDIADAWQKRNDAMDRDALWDEDDSPSTALPGDGLGLYEEYRGVHVQGDHSRLDPHTIDLFLCDEAGLVAHSTAIAAFGPMAFHLVTAAEMNMSASGDELKRINFNTPRGDKFVTDQHGLHVVRGTIAPGVYEGEEETSAPFAKAFPDHRHAAPDRSGPPIETDRIVVDRTRVRERVAGFVSRHLAEIEHERGAPMTATVVASLIEATASYIVVHEIGHGVGIDHHRPEESGAVTCPMRIPGTDPAGYSLFAVATGRMAFGERYCTGCIARLSVSDTRRAR
jgi:hypothetical protein